MNNLYRLQDRHMDDHSVSPKGRSLFGKDLIDHELNKDYLPFFSSLSSVFPDEIVWPDVRGDLSISEISNEASLIAAFVINIPWPQDIRILNTKCYFVTDISGGVSRSLSEIETRKLVSRAIGGKINQAYQRISNKYKTDGQTNIRAPRHRSEESGLLSLRRVNPELDEIKLDEKFKFMPSNRLLGFVRKGLEAHLQKISNAGRSAAENSFSRLKDIQEQRRLFVEVLTDVFHSIGTQQLDGYVAQFPVTTDGEFDLTYQHALQDAFPLCPADVGVFLLTLKAELIEFLAREGDISGAWGILDSNGSDLKIIHRNEQEVGLDPDWELATLVE